MRPFTDFNQRHYLAPHDFRQGVPGFDHQLQIRVHHHRCDRHDQPDRRPPGTDDAPQFDERGSGFPRIVGILNPSVPVIDIGAFEVQNGNQPGSPSNTQDFVAQVYRDLLDREADPGGLAAFTNLLDQGLVNRSQVVLAIENSLEYRSNVVVDLYSQLLHRDSDPSGFGAWVNFLGQGCTRNELEVSIISSQEYFIRRGGGTSSGFLQAIYQDILGRAPDPIGLASWLFGIRSWQMESPTKTSPRLKPNATKLPLQF